MEAPSFSLLIISLSYLSFFLSAVGRGSILVKRIASPPNFFASPWQKSEKFPEYREKLKYILAFYPGIQYNKMIDFNNL